MAVRLLHRKKKTRRVSADFFRPMRRSAPSAVPGSDPYERLLSLVLFAVGVVAIAVQPGQRAGSLLGLTVLCFGIVFLAGRYFLKFQRSNVSDLRGLVAMLGTGLLVLLVARLARESEGIHALVIPLPAVSIILAILFSPRLAIEAAAVLTVFCGVVLWGVDDYQRLLLTLFAGATTGALYSLRVRRPSRLLAVGVLVGTTQLLVLASFSLFREEIPTRAVLLRELSMGLGLGALSGFVVMGVLPFFERAMNRLSDITLLEYSNMNEQPVLRRLLIEANGTHSHSCRVADLSEAAAEAIGANGLLCRVGCYFHDIGKMSKPEYFSENSPDAKARHEELTPHMSKLIIIGHVKDGVEMAEDANLPESIQNFIKEHHGTTAVEYFYRLAVRMEPDKEILKEDYRYPGPRPRSRETAIVMIADSVDAASRSLRDPSPVNLEKLIDDIVDMKMRDRQLDDCGLTMRELTIVKESLYHVLVGFHHRRPRYPQDPSRSRGTDAQFLPELESGRLPGSGHTESVSGE